MAEVEKFSLTFDGQLASRGEMLLYEYGRAQYAFARLLTTVEQYRRRRVILRKISPQSRVKLTVRAPSKGSFQLDVGVDTTPAQARGTADFDVLLAVVLDRLIPPSDEFQDLATALAKVKLAEVRSGQQTGLPLNKNTLDSVAEIADGGAYSPDVLLKLVQWARSSPNRAIARADITADMLRRAEEITKSDIARKAVIAKHIHNLDSGEIDELAARVRPMFSELAVPLGDSADVLYIGSPKSRDLFYHLDRKRLALIGERELDEHEIDIDAKIKNFDVESGAGSMRVAGEPGVKYFSLDPAERNKIQEDVVIGMNREKVELKCAVYTDSNGIITSYMVRNISY